MNIKGTQSLTGLLKKGRKAKGMSQQELADAIGVGRTTLAMMEVDSDVMAGASFLTVLKAFRVVGYNLNLEDAPEPKNIEQINEENKEAAQSDLPKFRP